MITPSTWLGSTATKGLLKMRQSYGGKGEETLSNTTASTREGFAVTVVFGQNKPVDIKFASIFLSGTVPSEWRRSAVKVPVNVLRGLAM